MKRGIIILPKLEIQQALQHIDQGPATLLLYGKFNAAISDPNEEVNIQISEEELEVLMDKLPPPSSEAPLGLNSLRLSISQFLVRLRS